MHSNDSSDQIELCSNNIDSNIHMEIQTKTSKTVKLRNIFFTQSLMLPNIFRIKPEIPEHVTTEHGTSVKQ